MIPKRRKPSGVEVEAILAPYAATDAYAAAQAYRAVRYDCHKVAPHTWPQEWPEWSYASPARDKSLTEEQRDAAYLGARERSKDLLRMLGYTAAQVERRCRGEIDHSEYKREYARRRRAKLKAMEAAA